MMIRRQLVGRLRKGSAARVTSVALGLFGLFALCCVIGCSPGSPASVSGQVTFQGEPVENGAIQLRPTAETPGTGAAAKISGGSYQIAASEGLFAGTYTVSINATRPATPEEAARMAAEDEMPGEAADFESEEGGAAAPGKLEPTVQYIPDEYNIRSDLTVDLAAGENSKDFNLEGSGPGGPAASEEEED